jgi:hypothetical protein
MTLLCNPQLEGASNEIFVNELTWSREGHLACALSDGSILIAQLTSNNSALTTTVVVEADYCQTSALQWIRQTGRAKDTLVHVKPGAVYVGSACVPLPTVSSWSGATSLSPCCGTIYDERLDCVTVVLSDGSFHVLGMSEAPQLDAEATEHVTQFARKVATELEKASAPKFRVNRQDCFRIYGAIDVDPVVGMAWHYQSVFSFELGRGMNRLLIVGRFIFFTGGRHPSRYIMKSSRRSM